MLLFTAYPYTPIKSSFEDAGSVEDMMLYTELEAAVHAMIQRLEYPQKEADDSPDRKSQHGARDEYRLS